MLKSYAVIKNDGEIELRNVPLELIEKMDGTKDNPHQIDLPSAPVFLEQEIEGKTEEEIQRLIIESEQ